MKRMFLLVQALFSYKNSSANSSFDPRGSHLGSQFSCHATQKLENSNELYNNKKNLVEMKHCEKREAPVGSFI